MCTTTITPKVSESYEVGAILRDSWGCEQTNYDYYCIIKRVGDWLTIQPMTKIDEPLKDQSMTSATKADGIDPLKAAIRKKLKKSKEPWQLGKELGFSLDSGGWCSLWTGNISYASHYA